MTAGAIETIPLASIEENADEMWNATFHCWCEWPYHHNFVEQRRRLEIQNFSFIVPAMVKGYYGIENLDSNSNKLPCHHKNKVSNKSRCLDILSSNIWFWEKVML